ncbi:MAG: hypothetical protein AB7I41_11510 [Candidatus Sericytochromatia bacterium]
MILRFFQLLFLTRLSTSLTQRLPQGLFLLMMLAYVLIPHQGDYLDSLSLSPGLHMQASSQVKAEIQELSSFQAVLRGMPFAPESGPHAHNTQSLSHPENSGGATAFRFEPLPLQPDSLPILLQEPDFRPWDQDHFAFHPPPFLAQLASTLLLI